MSESSDDGFLQDMAARPDDTACRLIYADWLDERNDPRAELIRVNCELSALPKRHRKKRETLIQRENELLGSSLDRHWLRTVLIPRLEPQPSSNPNEPGEQFRLNNPGGFFEIVCDKAGSGLRIDGQPIALNWDDWAGSVGQVLLQTGLGSTLEDDIEQMRMVASGEIDQEKSLVDQIRPLLMCLGTGTYRVWLIDSASWDHVHWFDHGQKPQTTEWYPFDSAELIPSQPRDSIQEDRVNFWMEQIQAGKRPVMLVGRCEYQWCDFLIDGHHKLVASERAQIAIRAIVIQRQEVDREGVDVNDFFQNAPRNALKAYRRSHRRNVHNP